MVRLRSDGGMIASVCVGGECDEFASVLGNRLLVRYMQFCSGACCVMATDMRNKSFQVAGRWRACMRWDVHWGEEGSINSLVSKLRPYHRLIPLLGSERQTGARRDVDQVRNRLLKTFVDK